MTTNNKNLEIWNKYAEPPKEALKDFNNGTFSGTDINTMWRLKCLTEQFGICGIGWYYDIEKIWNEEGTQAETIMTFAEIKLYVKVDGEWSKGISGVGGNKMLTKTKGQNSYFKANDEAVKMAVTDAIGNACRNLGFGANVYWKYDKTKYTDENIANKASRNDNKNIPSEAQIKRLGELGGSVAVVATYFKKAVEEVTANDVQLLINRKEALQAKQKAKEQKEDANQ